MSPRAYAVATLLVQGATLLETREALHMGAKTFDRLVTEAETVVGQRLRRPLALQIPVALLGRVHGRDEAHERGITGA